MLTNRRHTMLMQEDKEDMRDWVTIIDTVTTEEIQNPSYEILPDGSKIEDYNFREVAVYIIYNANKDGKNSGYVRLSLIDVNGKQASAQSTKGIPSNGYCRLLFNMKLGNLINITDVFYSLNTSLSYSDFYDSTDTILSTVKRISLVSYTNIGVGSTIKIMAR